MPGAQGLAGVTGKHGCTALWPGNVYPQGHPSVGLLGGKARWMFRHVPVPPQHVLRERLLGLLCCAMLTGRQGSSPAAWQAVYHCGRVDAGREAQQAIHNTHDALSLHRMMVKHRWTHPPGCRDCFKACRTGMPPSDQSVSNLLVHKDLSSPAHLDPVTGADVDRSNTLFVCL